MEQDGAADPLGHTGQLDGEVGPHSTEHRQGQRRHQRPSRQLTRHTVDQHLDGGLFVVDATHRSRQQRRVREPLCHANGHLVVAAAYP
jgi:hypothetical protein